MVFEPLENRALLAITLFGDEFAVATDSPFPANDPSHFHSDNGGSFGNPPDVAEVGSFSSEEIRGMAEFNLTGQTRTTRATLKFLGDPGGLFGQSAGQFSVDIVAYAGNNVEELSDYSASTIGSLGSFGVSSLAGQSSIDITSIYNAAIDAGLNSLGIRIQATSSPGDDAAWMFTNFEVQVEPEFGINYLSTTTFITTDSITLRASIGAPTSGVQVTWTVEGQDAAVNITGFPTNFVTTTDDTGTATFTFTPSDNAALVRDRRTTWTRGSRTANTAISFEVTAKAEIDGQVYTKSLSDSGLGPLSQDETDILRQEYFDYNIPVPARDEVVPSLGAVFNGGNYGVQLSDDLQGLYDSVLAGYRGREVTFRYRGRDYVTHIPADATLTITSGYRNPQRNKAVGSVVPDSRHTRGKAHDLAPDAVTVQIVVNGRPTNVALPLHGTLYPALFAAAQGAGFFALAEDGAREVTLGNPSEDHIHVHRLS